MGVERDLDAGGEQAHPAFEGVVAVDVEDALAEEVEFDARQEVGFGAGEFGGVGLGFGSTGAQVGAAFDEALRGLAARGGRRVGEGVARAVR